MVASWDENLAVLTVAWKVAPTVVWMVVQRADLTVYLSVVQKAG